MSRFGTYHWQGVKLGDPALDAARSELASPSDEDAALRAFVDLLRSGVTAAVGIALDHYHYAISMERHGFGNVLRDFDQEVLQRARQILRDAPSAASETGASMKGRDSASALLIMINRAEVEDSESIARVLDAPPNYDAESAAFRSAGRILQLSAGVDERLVTALTRVVFDDGRDVDDRLEALQALSKSSSPQALADFRRALELNDLELQATAARALAKHDLVSHRSLIEAKAATWPEDAPYPASDVRDILAESDDSSEDE
ncbi:hypothetical protein QQY66_09045 [Streptomyces sp. DG2A-72]|uniref:hypothetical protein n=1 Tax=Streptomyces sp. DG2A-72 TaxID=3051386 RepID=UPI00265C4F8E|nr:hypothetical protein [Streptomyces sp. DG2A-72]MDO0931820.1 hypothetical protein [Streptomyces sp. DG2A-72]